MTMAELEEARRKLFPGIWTYNERVLLGREDLQPTFGTKAARFESARRVQPPYIQLELLPEFTSGVQLDWTLLRRFRHSVLAARPNPFPLFLARLILVATCAFFAINILLLPVGVKLPVHWSISGPSAAVSLILLAETFLIDPDVLGSRRKNW